MIKFDWKKEDTCSFSKELLKVDTLDRAKYAKYLTTYLNDFKNENYVFNINSQWGAGKTYFIKRWAKSLENKHPVIYFNSWKHDSNNEPLILILHEIIKGLKKRLKTKDFGVLDEKTYMVLKHVVPTLSKGLFRKFSGVNWDDLAPGNNNKDINSENKFVTEISESTAKALLELHEHQQQAINDLKMEIGRLLSEVICSEKTELDYWSPMYVFVDELDRCRPTFAIELLEVIKHIFDIPRVIFVIATDTEQLQHSIRAVYGSEFGADKYLMRFFNRSFSLPSPSLDEYLKTHRAFGAISKRLISTSDLKLFEFDETSSAEIVSYIFEELLIDLRTVDQIIERVNSILLNYKDEKGVITLIFLEALRVRKKDAYDRLLLNRTGDLAQFISTFENPSKRELRLTKSKSINENEFYKNIDVRDVNRSSKVNSRFTIRDLCAHVSAIINPVNKKNKNESTYNLLYQYLLDTLKTDGQDMLKTYKNYVEIASNLY